MVLRVVAGRVQVTYHGPGQLVLYPILSLHRLQPDLHWYLRSLEEVVIRFVAALGGLGLWLDIVDSGKL